MALPADEKFQAMTACFTLINLYGYDRGEEPHRIVFPGKIALQARAGGHGFPGRPRPEKKSVVCRIPPGCFR